MNPKARRLPDWIEHIREAIRNIDADIDMLDEEHFLGDGKTLRAVTKSLSDIGEAANRIMVIDPGMQQESPAAWEHLRRVYAMRNLLAHGYFRIDGSVVWATVKQDLPRLQKLLDELSNDGPKS
jgi:uncharacterized protein with HEPN domain